MAVAGDEDQYGENRMVVMEVFKDEITGIQNKEFAAVEMEVSQNYPNPFNGTSRIRIELGQKSKLELKVYNLVGQEVYYIPEAEVNPGIQVFTIDAKQLKPGVYFYTVTANKKSLTRKMVVE
jgi:hypothetical protein